MTKRPWLLWIVALLLGWAFDFLFWGKPIGINFPIYIALNLFGIFFLLLANGQKPAAKSLWLFIPIGFFAVITVLRQEPLTLFLAYTFTLVSMGLLAVTYLGGRWPQYSLFDYGNKFIQLSKKILLSPVHVAGQVRSKNETIRQTVKNLPIKSVLRGLLIAFPIVLFFACLLALGDVVFRQKLYDLLNNFNLGRSFEDLIRLVIILFWACVIAGAYQHASQHSQDEHLIGEDKPVIPSFLGFTEAAIVMGSVVVLFTSFVIIQFQYFFGGEGNIGVQGYTYSQYARSGFNELIIVAFTSLLLVLGLSTITRRVNTWQQRAYSGLSLAIVCLVIVILVSAYQRLTLAINWHGYSRLRLYPRVFLVWVGILFVAVIFLEILRRERYFAVAAVLASIGFAASLSILNVDASIVKHNVYRTLQGSHFNVNYLTTLSSDAVPALVDAFLDPVLPDEIHEGVGAALVCYLQSSDYKKYSHSDWRSYNYSKWLAVADLDEIKFMLQDYGVNLRIRPIQIRTPGKMVYVCGP